MGPSKELQCLRRINRRSLFKLAGCITGSYLALAPSDPNGTLFAASSSPSTAKLIGLFTPDSSLVPNAGERWLLGVREALGQAGIMGPLESRVYGKTPSLAAEMASGLLDGASAGAAIAFMDPHGAIPLARFCAAHKLPLVVTTLGANVTREGFRNESFAIESLELWRSAAMLGVWAARNVGKRAVAACSFYDAGYDLPFAFRCGYEFAGGEVLGSVVTHRPTEGTDLTAATATIKKLAPDVILASYCGPAAVDFVTACAQAGLERRVRLVTSSFTATEETLGALGGLALGLVSATPSLTDPLSSLGRRAVGRLIEVVGGAVPPPEKREFYLSEVQTGTRGLRNVVVEKSSPDDLMSRAVIEVESQLKTAVKSGWVYEYLCW